jgi:hypothetical protein
MLDVKSKDASSFVEASSLIEDESARYSTVGISRFAFVFEEKFEVDSCDEQLFTVCVGGSRSSAYLCCLFGYLPTTLGARPMHIVTPAQGSNNRNGPFLSTMRINGRYHFTIMRK